MDVQKDQSSWRKHMYLCGYLKYYSSLLHSYPYCVWLTTKKNHTMVMRRSIYNDFQSSNNVLTCLPKHVSGISGADGRIKGITWEDFNIMIRIANKHYTNWKIDIRIVGRTPELSRFIIFWEASILYWEANLPSPPAL